MSATMIPPGVDEALWKRAVATEGYFKPEEAHLLLETVRAAGDNAQLLEVGSYHGRSTLFTLAAMGPHQRLVAVDSFLEVGRCRGHSFTQLRERVEDPRIVVLPMSLAEAAAHLAPCSFAVVLLDADHSFAAVAGDLSYAIHLAQPDARLLCHDVATSFPGVRWTIEALQRAGVLFGTGARGSLASFRIINRPAWLLDASAQAPELQTSSEHSIE